MAERRTRSYTVFVLEPENNSYTCKSSIKLTPPMKKRYLFTHFLCLFSVLYRVYSILGNAV